MEFLYIFTSISGSLAIFIIIVLCTGEIMEDKRPRRPREIKEKGTGGRGLFFKI